MYITLVDNDNDTKQANVRLGKVGLFMGFVETWEVPAGMDRAMVAEALAEYARLSQINEWWQAKIYFGDFLNYGIPVFPRLRSWIEKLRVRPALTELEGRFGAEGRRLYIHLPLDVIESFKASEEFLVDMLGICTVIKTLHDRNLFADAAASKNFHILIQWMDLILDFLDRVRQWANPANRNILRHAMHFSDFTRLNIVDMMRDSQRILFQSPSMLDLFELCHVDAHSEIQNLDGDWDIPLFQCVVDGTNSHTIPRVFIKTSPSRFHDGYKTSPEVQAVFHGIFDEDAARRRGYFYGTVHLPPADRPGGKAMLRWDRPLVLQQTGQPQIPYPAELDSEYHVVIDYRFRTAEGGECSQLAAPALCQAVYNQLASHYIESIDTALVSRPAEGPAENNKRHRA